MTQENNRSPGWLYPVALLAFLALFVGALYWVKSVLNPAPASGEIIVEFYTDGSEACQTQARVIRELESEYDGPITFKTIDIRQHPDLTQSYQGSEFGAVKHVPAVRISHYRYDADGKVVASGWSMLGKMPKRHLVQSIEGAASSGSVDWPPIPISRRKPPVP